MIKLETWTEDMQYECNRRLTLRLCDGETPPVIEISLPDIQDKIGKIRHNSVSIPVKAIKKLLEYPLD